MNDASTDAPSLIGPTEIAADARLAEPGLVGGKAAGLAALQRAGLPVPAWFCVTTAVTLGPDGQLAPADADAILARFDAEFAADARVAVRSSAADEDSSGDSFAGQLATCLYVTRDELGQRVAEVLRSASAPGVLLYRQVRGLGQVTPRAAAVVQVMVESRVAGVMFTANPTSGARDEAVITAGLGLGEGIVGDLVETDTWRLALATGEVRERQIGAKRARIVLDREAGRGTRREEVPAAEGDRPALSDERLQAVCALGRLVEDRCGAAQDIEWALDHEGQLHLLQARPITTLERESLFDNSNIVESYPGISCPLTYSFARYAYEQTFRQGSRTFGVPEEILNDRWHVHANLLGLIDGRIYYNILNWYELFFLVPGFEGVLPAWEKALGLPARHAKRPPERSRPLLKLKIVWRSLRHYVGLDANVAEFQATFERHHRRFVRLDLDAHDPHDLVELYERLCREILPAYAISLVNDFFAQQSYELVGKLVARYELGEPDALRNELLCGEQGMDSVEPIRSILRIVDLLRERPELAARVQGDEDPVDVWDALREDEELCLALDRHIDRYGDRTLHELKLETPPVEEDPKFLITMLANYLRGGQDLAAMEAREREIRDQAEAAVRAGLGWRPLRRLIFNWVLADCRRSVRYRENLRLSRSRAFGMIKRIFRALGRRLAEDGLLEEADDVFWLGVEEVTQHVRGHALTRDLRGLIALRRADYARFAETHPAPRVGVQGIVAAHRFGVRRLEGPAAADDGGLLRGTGCSPGVVRARAKVIDSPQADLRIDGQILVSPMTDPGWVFLMVAAGGLVVERGSMLSHTAIIGRELGIPTVVGVADATRRIQDGDLLELDGRAGTVQIVSESEAAEPE